MAVAKETENPTALFSKKRKPDERRGTNFAEKWKAYELFLKRRKPSVRSKIMVPTVVKKKTVIVLDEEDVEDSIVGKKICLRSSYDDCKNNDGKMIYCHGNFQDNFEDLQKIGRGGYGVVFKAKDKKTGEIVALKKELNESYLTLWREIHILSSLPKHPSIVDLKRVLVDDTNGVFIVMECLACDLFTLIHGYTSDPLSLSDQKLSMKQLLEGVKFLHENNVMHRDLKPSNILLDDNCQLKICDFGLSRRFEKRRADTYTTRVATLWYRAPELLLGATKYSCSIDMWSVGCIMAELILRKPLFKGDTEIQQVDQIFKVLGTPNDSVWPGFSDLPGVSSACFVKKPYNMLRHKVPVDLLSDLGFDLLYRLLAYDPQKRISAEEALNHGWFKEF